MLEARIHGMTRAEESNQNWVAEVSCVSSISTNDCCKQPSAMSISRSPSLKPAYLPSPRDPSMWKEASPLARFGLDIGGTLCKVVHFEPLREPQNEDKMPTSWPVTQVEPLAEEESSKRGDTNENIMKNTGLLNSGHSIGKVYACNVFDPSHNTVEASRLNGFPSSKETDVSAEVAKKAHGSELDATIHDADTIEIQERSRKECFRREFNKLWVSSHQPVNLPGRGTLYFKCFETWRMEEFLSLTKELSLVSKDRAIGATGGGARKFCDHFLEIAGLHLERADELRSLVRGIDFLARHAHQESFEYPMGPYRGGAIQRPLRLTETDSDNDIRDDHSADENDDSCKVVNDCSTCGVPSADLGDRSFKNFNSHGSNFPGAEYFYQINANEALYPYLVVNIGSGVSILRVDSTDKFERVGGTSLGGSTFLGLAAALTGCNSFEEAIQLASEGDSTQIDMLVGDIYGGDYKEMNLASTTVASSFGKLVHPEKRSAAMKQPHHLAKAALLMVTNNIGSLAMLHAQTAGVKHVMFTGSFLHGNELAMRLLAVAMEFWTKGSMQAIFLRHEGHAGAVGALLNSIQISDPIDRLLLDESVSIHI